MIKTKQELLNHFSDINGMYNNPFMYQTLSNMIDELLEQQSCEDCISRTETLKAFAEKCGGECGCCVYNGSGYDTAENCKLIKSMPSVTPKPKTGHWEDCSNGWMCSNCYKDVSHESDFCPHCGADMRGYGMRDATEEERKSTKDYIDSISKPTGIQFDDIYEEEDKE